MKKFYWVSEITRAAFHSALWIIYGYSFYKCAVKHGAETTVLTILIAIFLIEISATYIKHRYEI